MEYNVSKMFSFPLPFADTFFNIFTATKSLLKPHSNDEENFEVLVPTVTGSYELVSNVFQKSKGSYHTGKQTPAKSPTSTFFHTKPTSLRQKAPIKWVPAAHPRPADTAIKKQIIKLSACRRLPQQSNICHLLPGLRRKPGSFGAR